MFQRIALADPKLIDILQGYDYFCGILRDGRVMKDGKVIAQNTFLGYVLFGSSLDSGERLTSLCNFTTSVLDLNKALQLFWKLGDVPN